MPSTVAPCVSSTSHELNPMPLSHTFYHTIYTISEPEGLVRERHTLSRSKEVCSRIVRKPSFSDWSGTLYTRSISCCFSALPGRTRELSNIGMDITGNGFSPTPREARFMMCDRPCWRVVRTSL